MLKNINQKDERLLKAIQEYGCLFLCFAESSPLTFEGESGCMLLNMLWEKAVDEGYIINNTIVGHTDIAHLLRLNVHFDNQHHSAEDKIPENVSFVFGMFVWKYSHFVVLDKNKKVTFDPLVNSNTVKNGVLKSMRFYYAD